MRSLPGAPHPKSSCLEAVSCPTGIFNINFKAYGIPYAVACQVACGNCNAVACGEPVAAICNVVACCGNCNAVEISAKICYIG